MRGVLAETRQRGPATRIAPLCCCCFSAAGAHGRRGQQRGAPERGGRAGGRCCSGGTEIVSLRRLCVRPQHVAKTTKHISHGLCRTMWSQEIGRRLVSQLQKSDWQALLTTFDDLSRLSPADAGRALAVKARSGRLAPPPSPCSGKLTSEAFFAPPPAQTHPPGQQERLGPRPLCSYGKREGCARHPAAPSARSCQRNIDRRRHPAAHRCTVQLQH